MIAHVNLTQIHGNLKSVAICNRAETVAAQGIFEKSQIDKKSGRKTVILEKIVVSQRFSTLPRFVKDPPHYMWAKPQAVRPHVDAVSSLSTFPTPNRRTCMTTPILLCIDLGTSTGWACLDGHGAILSGTERFAHSRFEGGGMRYLRFKRWLTETKNGLGYIDAVYFEEVRRHVGVDAAHAYGGFLAHLTAWCEHHAIPYEGVPVGTIKRFIAGKGNADKDAVIAAIKARGHTPEDDNEADALAILYWAKQQHEEQRGA